LRFERIKLIEDVARFRNRFDGTAQSRDFGRRFCLIRLGARGIAGDVERDDDGDLARGVAHALVISAAAFSHSALKL